MPRFAPYLGVVVATMLGITSAAVAGVVNPNISVTGQPFTRWTDAAGDPTADRAVLDVGETEFVYDDYLNPYARGFFTIALSREGAEVEEGYFNLLRGLPLGLTLKCGKYRVEFGKLNPMHYGQLHIMPSESGDSAPMADDPPTFLFITENRNRQSPALRTGRSLCPDLNQEVQCS